MAKTTYSELLRDPRWQKVRLKKLDAAEWKCERCMDHETMLSVHHKRYVKGRMPWEYTDPELVVLCQPCHEEVHEGNDFRSELMAHLDIDGPCGIEDFFAYGAGAVAEWIADETLKAMLVELSESKPHQFYASRFARNLEHFGLDRSGFKRLVDLQEKAELSDVGDRLFAELIALLEKYEVPLSKGEP